jgi:hypothetical protein
LLSKRVAGCTEATLGIYPRGFFENGEPRVRIFSNPHAAH